MGYRCEYAAWQAKPDFPPGWCQVADSSCDPMPDPGTPAAPGAQLHAVGLPPRSCPEMAGGWSATPAGDVVTVTQRGCDLAATDAAQQCLGAAGAFYDQRNVNMVFEYGGGGGNLSLTGHLNRSRGRPRGG